MAAAQGVPPDAPAALAGFLPLLAFVGFAAIPVYRQADLHPFMVSYQPAQIGMPAGCLVIGSKIDVIAMAWTCSLTATDRALLEGMRITPNFVPSEGKVTEPERK